MKFIDLYLDEIQRLLPIKDREDILREIRSNIMDTIEDRNSNPGESPDEDLIKSVLKEFGSPHEIAQQYGAHNYLVGPRLFPIYIQVLRIVLIVIGALNILGVIVAIVGQGGFATGAFQSIFDILWNLIGSLFTAFGVVTLSFAGIERTSPKEWKVNIDEEWQPEELLKREDRQEVKIAGAAIEITLSVIFIALLNFFLDRIGIYYLSEGTWVSAPILNDVFLRYIPWITASIILDIGLNLYLIRQGYWDKFSVIAKVLINAFIIAVTFVILTGPDIITISPTAWETLGFDVNFTAEQLNRTLNTVVEVLMGLSIFGMVVDAITRMYNGFFKGNQARFEIEVG